MSTDTPARRFRPPSTTTLVVVLSTIVGTVAVVAIVLAILLGAKLNRTVADIQTERVTNTRASCESQNQRNRKAKVELAERAVDPAVLVFAGALIDALVPERDCDVVVATQVGSAKEDR